MTGFTVDLKVVLLYGQHCHDLALQDLFNPGNLVILLTEDLQVVSGGGQRLNYTVGLETLGSTEVFRSKKENKKGQSLKRDLGTKDGKHFSY